MVSQPLSSDVKNTQPFLACGQIEYLARLQMSLQITMLQFHI